MKNTIDYSDDYSVSYRAQLTAAISESKKLGFNRPLFISERLAVADETLAATAKFLNQFSGFLDTVVPGYWGNSCQTLSTNIFAQLNGRGIAADIVLGNVIINGTDEFDTTLKILQNEYFAEDDLIGHQQVHAWVTLGDDTIVDAALPPRLAKHYNAPGHFNDMIFINRAATLSSRFKVRYQPILVGTEFFAKTNPPDPMDLLKSIQSLRY
ncbi:hypothetical protein [Duganella levis]|uniref:Uncharacterized protein n=1 Tax=Duganella levis TaxID=2692169 RepID=A0ABW9W3P6_9BURK|nr:hypothetical protein [Duganella levis]MYN28607.1 hypothetical protein [Duganella levis]